MILKDLSRKLVLLFQRNFDSEFIEMFTIAKDFHLQLHLYTNIELYLY